MPQAFPGRQWTAPKEAPGENLENTWRKLQAVPQKAITVPTQNVVVWSQQKVSRPQSAPSRREEQSELAKIPSTSKRRPTTSDRFRGAKCPVERMERPGLQRSGTRNSLLSEETYHGTIDLTGPGSSTAASRGSVEFQPEGEQFAIEHPQQSRCGFGGMCNHDAVQPLAAIADSYAAARWQVHRCHTEIFAYSKQACTNASTSRIVLTQLNEGCTWYRSHGEARERRIIRNAVRHPQRFAADTSVWAAKRDAQRVKMFSHQTRESLGQLQETIQSVQPVAGDRSEEIKKAVREEVMMEVMSQVKKLHEEAFKGGGKGEASSSWKGKEIRKEEVKDEEVQKAGWVFVSACAGQVEMTNEQMDKKAKKEAKEKKYQKGEKTKDRRKEKTHSPKGEKAKERKNEKAKKDPENEKAEKDDKKRGDDRADQKASSGDGGAKQQKIERARKLVTK
ncbi:unnamed protein product [Cladocopium goreaui]|uniref:Uncharacterized protein n=1 Tax=Cladocopium goreaui TaxID=2562237 RepID=A0A9P1BFW6_9DINO|nr:unnamed protein product [Cladocopium goreaui]